MFGRQFKGSDRIGAFIDYSFWMDQFRFSRFTIGQWVSALNLEPNNDHLTFVGVSGTEKQKVLDGFTTWQQDKGLSIVSSDLLADEELDGSLLMLDCLYKTSSLAQKYEKIIVVGRGVYLRYAVRGLAEDLHKIVVIFSSDPVLEFYAQSSLVEYHTVTRDYSRLILDEFSRLSQNYMEAFSTYASLVERITRQYSLPRFEIERSVNDLIQDGTITRGKRLDYNRDREINVLMLAESWRRVSFDK